MESFSLLKHWKTSVGISTTSSNGGGATTVKLPADDRVSNTRVTTSTTTIFSSASHTSSEAEDDDDVEDGPFFDLEFTLPDGGGGDGDGDGSITNDENDKDEDDTDGENEREFKFTLSSSSSDDDRTDPNECPSPSDDLFFKGRLVPVESDTSSSNFKSQFPVSLLKSATKFRVSMLKLKKSKSNGNSKTESEQTESQKTEEKYKQKQPTRTHSKFFTVKFKVEEVPIVSMFTRDYSARSSKAKQNADDSSTDEKRFSKDVMHKYLKMVNLKPFYVRVSKRYANKLKLSGQLSLSGAAKACAGPPPACKAAVEDELADPLPVAKTRTEATAPGVSEAPPPLSNVKCQKQGNLQAGLRVVYKHLGKSRSASGSAAVAAAPSGLTASSRRDDSLLQQQDGIQSAILHCKTSFNASRGSTQEFHSEAAKMNPTCN